MMKLFTSRYFVLIILFALTCCINASAQLDIHAVGQKNVDDRKAQGLLTGHERYSNSQAKPQTTRVAPSTPSTQSSLCNCWIERDGSWQVGQFDYQGGSGGPGTPPDYRNDDWSTNAIAL